MEKMFITADDFMVGGNAKGLNFNGFTNLEKGMDEQEFKFKYPADKYEVYTSEGIAGYMQNVIQKTASLEKGIESEEFKSAREQLSTLTKVLVKGEDGDVAYFVRAKEELEKAHISDAFQFAENEMKFPKKGKEIKDKIMGLKSKYQEEKTAEKAKMEMYLEKIGVPPTMDCPEYKYRGCKEQCGEQKHYPWTMCMFSTHSDNVKNYGDGANPYGNTIEDKQFAEDVKQAQYCKAYNEAVDKYIDYCVELCYMQTMLSNMVDEADYELTPHQIVALGLM